MSLYSLPVCLLVDGILHANNLRDAAADRVARVCTLATLLPPSAARLWHQVLLFGPLVFVGLGVQGHLLPLWSLGSLLSAPLVWKSGTMKVKASDSFGSV